MKELFSLGKIYPSDFLKPDEQPRCEPVELKLMMTEDGIVQLDQMAPANVLWGSRYWYSSSISNTMKKQLKDVVDSTLEVFDPRKYEEVPIWVDIAGNSGYMLSQVPDLFMRINIDPVCQNEDFYREAHRNCEAVIPEFFSKNVVAEYRKANIVSCISMFYDLSDPTKFLNDVYEILDKDGLFVLQMSYSPLMLEQLEFSNICHEHARYYCFFNLKVLLEKHSFKIMDVSLNNTNAGSFRIFCMKDIGDESKFGSWTHRDVSRFRIASLLGYEKTLKLNETQTWLDFFYRISELRKKTLDFLHQAKEEDKTVMGYGASTKFNTVAQYFSLTPDLISAVAERSPAKYGTRLIGTNIPIISEEEMRDQHPDYLIIGPFQFLSEFMEREAEYLDRGGKFVTLMPTFSIISK